MQQVKWTERRFLFGYDKNYAPLFIERLQATVPRLKELLEDCEDLIASAPNGEAWSIKQHIGHLTDLEILHSGRIDDFAEGLPMLRPADMTNKATWQADHNNKPLSVLLAEFRKSREGYLNKIAAQDEEVLHAKAMHPRLQQVVSFTDMLYFVTEHDTNHLARIAAILDNNK